MRWGNRCPAAAAPTLLCGAAVFCAPGLRLCIGIALIVAANLPFNYPLYLNETLVLAAVVVNSRGAFLRKR